MIRAEAAGGVITGLLSLVSLIVMDSVAYVTSDSEPLVSVTGITLVADMLSEYSVCSS